MKSILLPVAALLLAGCSGGHLYPVKGPLATQTPAPVYSVKMGNGDQITARVGGGDVCRGLWLDVVKEDPTVRDMADDWDLIYGKGYFDANVLGHIGIARSTLKCDKTGNLKTEFDSSKGVAQDDAGNVFRLTF